MNSKNSETSDPHKLIINVTDKNGLQKVIHMLHLQLKKIKMLYKNSKFKLLDASYSVSEIQDYFEYILKNIEKRLIIL